MGKNPTDRGKKGTKKSILVEADGGPLAAVIDGANVADAKLLRATIEAIVVERPKPSEDKPQHLCLDKGYDNPTARKALEGTGYTAHIRLIREERRKSDPSKGEKPRRWVVERTIAWLKGFRRMRVRYDRLAVIQEAWNTLAACAICFRLLQDGETQHG